MLLIKVAARSTCPISAADISFVWIEKSASLGRGELRAFNHHLVIETVIETSVLIGD